jgi:hypothetical protein
MSDIFGPKGTDAKRDAFAPQDTPERDMFAPREHSGAVISIPDWMAAPTSGLSQWPRADQRVGAPAADDLDRAERGAREADTRGVAPTPPMAGLDGELSLALSPGPDYSPGLDASPAESAGFQERDEQRHQDQERQQAAFLAALDKTDPDYSVLEIDVKFKSPGVMLSDGTVAGSDVCFEDWDLAGGDDEEAGYDDRRAELYDAIVAEVAEALSPWFASFAMSGFIRCDRPFEAPLSVPGEDAAATLYLPVCAAGRDKRLTTLAEWPVRPATLKAAPGATLKVSGAARWVNATRLFEALAKTDEPILEWGGDGTPERMPREGEGRDEWLSRVALSAEASERLLERWETVGRDPQLLARFGTAAERSVGAEEGEPWLVEGRLKRRVVTSLVGDGGAGKSGLAHEIASALGCIEVVTSRPRTVLGKEVSGRHVVAFLTGEEDEDDWNLRAEAHAHIWGESEILPCDGDSRSFTEWLEELEGLPLLDLVIVDPVISFLDGDEDSADVVSDFYHRLRRLARSKSCAVLVVHHLKKGVVRSLSPQMLDMVRGSKVHTNRPRLVIGMRSLRNGSIEIGPIKCNFTGGAWLPTFSGELYRRDGESHTLVPLHEKGGAGVSDGTADDASERVLAAVRRLNRENSIVRRSGKRGLFELRPPELAGVARAAILSAIVELSAQGAVSDGAGGLVAAS